MGETDRRDPTVPTATMMLSGYAVGLVHRFGQPRTHHVYYDIEEHQLELFPGITRHSYRFKDLYPILNGDKLTLDDPNRQFIHDDRGPDVAEVTIGANYEGTHLTRKFRLPGRYYKP